MRMLQSGRRFLLAVGLCFAVALAFLAYPVYVIRPFRYQGPRELMMALTAVRYRPAVETVCVAAAIAALVWYWRREARWLRRTAAVAATLAVGAVALLSRINIYELMFHPIPALAFGAARDAKLDGEEKVIAVSLNGAARAYPIRSMSYHHVANDVLGGVPIVATY